LNWLGCSPIICTAHKHTPTSKANQFQSKVPPGEEPLRTKAVSKKVYIKMETEYKEKSEMNGQDILIDAS